MDVVDMDLAGNVSGFTLSSSSRPSARLRRLEVTAGRLGYSVFGFAIFGGFAHDVPQSWRGAGLNVGGTRRGIQTRVQRVAWVSSRAPQPLGCRGLFCVTDLNSGKSTTYSTRLTRRIIGAGPAV
jgi:hypothetical protein